MDSVEAKKAAALDFEARFAIDHFAREGVTRASLFSLLERYYGAYDAMGEVLLPTPGGPTRAACSKGCAWCCRTIIVVTAPEAFYVADHIERTRGEAGLSAAIHHVRATDAATRGKVGAERWGFGPPCPLLDEAEGACSVYPGRPLACRGTFSSSLEGCKAAFAVRATDPRFEGKRPFLFQNSEVFIRALAFGLQSQGRQLHRLELNAALTVIWSMENALDQWLNGVDIFADARAPDASAPAA
jgi:Fe-S-cluster containining protein